MNALIIPSGFVKGQNVILKKYSKTTKQLCR